jgi:hypothetical protein
VEPAKNSTLATVAVPTADALAVTVVAVPTVRDVPEVGAVIATDGAVTLTLTIGDVAVAPAESVTRAVMGNTPAADGVHVNE